MRELEKDDVITIFYSAPLFPMTETSCEQLEPLDTESISESEVRSLVQKESSIQSSVGL